MANATRTPHEYKFTKATTYAEAIKYDAKEKGRIVTCESNNSSFSKNDLWINSKYFGFINSRLYAGTDGNNLTKQDFNLKWENGSWCDYKVKGYYKNFRVNKQAQLGPSWECKYFHNLKSCKLISSEIHERK